jgi:hypothetical protein
MDSQHGYSAKAIATFMRNVRLPGDPAACWVWIGSKHKNSHRGYFSMLGQTVFAHQFAYRLFRGLIMDGMCVCHTCDNPECVNPDHLWLGTHAENMADMVRKGRQAKLTRDCVPTTKIRTSLMAEIQQKHGVMPASEIAKQYGVTERTIYRLFALDGSRPRSRRGRRASVANKTFSAVDAARSRT